MADWIEHDDALRTLLDGAPTLIGLDTEFMRTDTFLPRLALVQIEIAGHIALIDPTAGIEPAPFASVLADPARVCVMHSASEDLEAFATWSCAIANLFDTQIAASFAGLGAGLGYQKLVLELTGIDVPKGSTSLPETMPGGGRFGTAAPATVQSLQVAGNGRRRAEASLLAPIATGEATLTELHPALVSAIIVALRQVGEDNAGRLFAIEIAIAHGL